MSSSNGSIFDSNGSVFEPMDHDSDMVVDVPPYPLRAKVALWDRAKFLALFAGLFAVLVWSTIASTPIEPLGSAINGELHSAWWLIGLAGLELVRQVHYAIAERSWRWNRFVTDKVFGGADRRMSHFESWTRYRMGRVLKILVLLAVASVVLGRVYHVSAPTALFDLPSKLVQALPLIAQVAITLVVVVGQFVAIFWFLSKGGVETYFPGDVKTRFSDVWGQDSVLERVKENIIFLRGPEAIEARGGYVPGGILLWGPPGTGKTLMAEAVAGETGNPFVFVEPAAFTNMFVGVGVLKVKSLFRKLRKLAMRYGGVVVFFDEADSLGSRGSLSPGGIFGRMTPAGSPLAHNSCNGLSWMDPATSSLLVKNAMSSSSSSAPFGEGPDLGWRQRAMAMGMGGGGGGMGTLQALLAEMSGLRKPRGFMNRYVRKALGMRPKLPPKYRMLVMMATNMPEALDEAMLRPGRIDRIYKVGYPSKKGRIRTYKGYLDKVAHQLNEEEIDRLATITPYATGATIKDMVNEALINTIREGRDVITWRDIIKAKQLKDLGPPEDVEYIERERHAVAVHEACHAVAAAKVRHHLTIDIATIEKGGTYLGMVASIPPEDQFTRWRSEYEADIIVALASLAGERMFFGGDNSSGVSGDLESATQIATLMEGYWGMGQTVTSHGVTHQVGIGGAGKPGSDDRQKEKSLLESSLGGRIEEKLTELLTRAEALLGEHRTMVLAVAHALETHKTLTGDDVMAVINGTEGPLLDGRPYASPEFAEVAEEYHRRALEAHRGHSGVEVPLPRFEPHPEPQFALSPSMDYQAPQSPL